MSGGDHVDDPFVVVDEEEESPGADAVAPGRGRVVLQSADIGSEVGSEPELWVDDALTGSTTKLDLKADVGVETADADSRYF